MLNECNGCEYQCNLSHIDICTLGSPCPHQRSTPMTNYERITQNEKTLAEFICGDMDCAYCVGYGGCDGNKDALVEWLKQPHTFE